MKRVFVLVACAVVVAPAVEAQNQAVAPGARVRVTAPAKGLERHVTTVENVRGDSIVVGFGGGWQTIALRDMTSLDVSMGRESRFFADAGIGLAVGVLAGGLVGAVGYQECTDCILAPANRAQSAALGAILAGTVGLVAGAIVGVFHRPDRWRRYELPIKSTIARLPSGGIGLGISRAF